MIRCDKCGEKLDISAGVFTDDWVEIMRLLPSFSPNSKIVFEYVELHNVFPLQTKSKKILRLLTELAGLYEHEKFRFGKAEYSISKKGISEALTIVCNKNFSGPLDGHNYLKKVMISISEKELKERRDADDKALRKKENRILNQPVTENKQTEEVIPLSEFKKRHGIEKLAEQIGRKI